GRSLFTRVKATPPRSDRAAWRTPLSDALRQLSVQAALAVEELAAGPLPDWRLYQIQAAFPQVRLAQRAQDEPASTGAARAPPPRHPPRPAPAGPRPVVGRR